MQMSGREPHNTQQEPGSGRRKWLRFWQIVAVLAVCTIVRVWLIRRAEVIAKDSIVYMKLANRWAADPSDYLRTSAIHPGYPAAMAWAGSVIGALELAPTGDQMELAGRIVSVVAGLAALVAIWAFAGLAFNWRIAWISALLFGLGRKWTQVNVEVLTDSLAICLQMWAVVLAMLALEGLKRNRKATIGLAAAVGALGAAGYLVRPEAFIVAPMAAALWLAWLIRPGRNWRVTLAAVGAMALTAAAISLPYMMTIGGFTVRKDLSDFIAPAAVAASGNARAVCVLAVAAIPHAGILSLGSRFIAQLFEAIHPVLGFLACLWALARLCRFFAPVACAEDAVPSPRPATVFVPAAWAAMFFLPLFAHTLRHGVLSHRYLMFAAAMLCPLAGAAVTSIGQWVAMLTAKGRWPVSRRAATCILTVVIASAMAAHAMRPPHKGKEYYKRAGLFLRGIAGPNDYVLADPWVVHYARTNGSHVVRDADGTITRQTLLHSVRTHPATYLVIRDDCVNAHGEPSHKPCIAQMLRPPAFTELPKFVQDGRRKGGVLRVYRIDRAALNRPQSRPEGPPTDATEAPTLTPGRGGTAT